MREILFRGKRVDNGEWAEGYLWIGNDFLCITPHNVGISYDEKAKRVIAFAHEVDRKTVCQYTGLTDKNGRKIFEGDIVDADDTIGIVKFGKYKNEFHYGYYIEWIKCPLLRQELGYWNVESKVVGNIFDNPELLKGGKN